MSFHADRNGVGEAVYSIPPVLLFPDWTVIVKLTFSLSPRDFGVGEAGWAGLCFSPSQWSMVEFSKFSLSNHVIFERELKNPFPIVKSIMHTFNKLSDAERLTFSLSPRDFGVGEAGWAGLCFSPSQWSMTAVAHSFGITINVYDQDLHLWTFLCNSSNGNIAVGGADRTMPVYDPHRWAAVSRWVNYEITRLSFSSVDPNYAYIQGVDYEARTHTPIIRLSELSSEPTTVMLMRQ